MWRILWVFDRLIQQGECHTAVLHFEYILAQFKIDQVYNKAKQYGKQEYGKRYELKVTHAMYSL